MDPALFQQHYVNSAVLRYARAEPAFLTSPGWDAYLIGKIESSGDGTLAPRGRLAFVARCEYGGIHFSTLNECIAALNGIIIRFAPAASIDHPGETLADCSSCLETVIVHCVDLLVLHEACRYGHGSSDLLSWIKSAEQFLSVVDLFALAGGQLAPCQALELARFAQTRRAQKALSKVLDVYGVSRADDLIALIHLNLLTAAGVVSLVQDLELFFSFLDYHRFYSLLRFWKERGAGSPLHGFMRRIVRGTLVLPELTPPPLGYVERALCVEPTFAEPLSDVHEESSGA